MLLLTLDVLWPHEMPCTTVIIHVGAFGAGRSEVKYGWWLESSQISLVLLSPPLLYTRSIAQAGRMVFPVQHN